MKYDFDKIIDRKHNYSFKYDVEDGCLPMWVADMDFECFEGIKKALNNQVEHGIFGYSTLPDTYFEAYQNWFNHRYNCGYEISDMIFSTGVVAAISSIVRSVTNIGDNVLVIEPVYNIFYNSIINNHRQVLTSSLINNQEVYSIDFVDLEAKMALPQTTLLIFCNPHNPVGKLWTKEELTKVAELAKRHNVIVISDEIHCDLVNPGFRYNPYFTSNSDYDRMIILHSPSKTFNVAGLHGACCIVRDQDLHYKVWRGINTDEVGEPNILVVPAIIAAYNEGEEYLKALNEYLYQNKVITYNFIKENLPHLKTKINDATYLMWVDASYYIEKYFTDSKDFCEKLRKEAKVFFSSGIVYGEGGKNYFRINLATPKVNVLEGLKRLKAFLDNYE